MAHRTDVPAPNPEVDLAVGEFRRALVRYVSGDNVFLEQLPALLDLVPVEEQHHALVQTFTVLSAGQQAVHRLKTLLTAVEQRMGTDRVDLLPMWFEQMDAATATSWVSILTTQDGGDAELTRWQAYILSAALTEPVCRRLSPMLLIRLTKFVHAAGLMHPTLYFRLALADQIDVIASLPPPAMRDEPWADFYLLVHQTPGLDAVKRWLKPEFGAVPTLMRLARIITSRSHPTVAMIRAASRIINLMPLRPTEGIHLLEIRAVLERADPMLVSLLQVGIDERLKALGEQGWVDPRFN